jgi:hypothetical protein
MSGVNATLQNKDTLIQSINCDNLTFRLPSDYDNDSIRSIFEKYQAKITDATK